MSFKRKTTQELLKCLVMRLLYQIDGCREEWSRCGMDDALIPNGFSHAVA